MRLNQKGLNYQKLLRLLRLPRLFRMLRIIKVMKSIKFLKDSVLFMKFERRLKMNAAYIRMVQGIFFALLITHLFSCFFYLSAKFADFHPDTWVNRLNLVDRTISEQYLYSFYWSVQTLVTAGYGDISAETSSEMFLSLFWMLFGVSFYSFIIGNYTSIISGNVQVSASISLKIQSLKELTQRAQIPLDLMIKIKKFIENNYEALFNREEEANFVSILPPSLRDEVVASTFGEIVENIEFFREMEDQDFLWRMLPLLRPVKLEKGDTLYWRGDHAEDIYFILKGMVKIYTERGYPYISYSEGSVFGDSDTLLNLPRDGKAIAMTHLKLMVLKIDTHFQEVFINHEKNLMEMILDARRKRNHHLRLIYAANKKQSLLVNKSRKSRRSTLHQDQDQQMTQRGSKFVSPSANQKKETDEDQQQGIFSKLKNKIFSTVKRNQELFNNQNKDATQASLANISSISHLPQTPLEPKSPMLILPKSPQKEDDDAERRRQQYIQMMRQRAFKSDQLISGFSVSKRNLHKKKQSEKLKDFINMVERGATSVSPMSINTSIGGPTPKRNMLGFNIKLNNVDEEGEQSQNNREVIANFVLKKQKAQSSGNDSKQKLKNKKFSQFHQTNSSQSGILDASPKPLQNMLGINQFQAFPSMSPLGRTGFFRGNTQLINKIHMLKEMSIMSGKNRHKSVLANPSEDTFQNQILQLQKMEQRILNEIKEEGHGGNPTSSNPSDQSMSNCNTSMKPSQKLKSQQSSESRLTKSNNLNGSYKGEDEQQNSHLLSPDYAIIKRKMISKIQSSPVSISGNVSYQSLNNSDGQSIKEKIGNPDRRDKSGENSGTGKNNETLRSSFNLHNQRFIVSQAQSKQQSEIGIAIQSPLNNSGASPAILQLKQANEHFDNDQRMRMILRSSQKKTSTLLEKIMSQTFDNNELNQIKQKYGIINQLSKEQEWAQKNNVMRPRYSKLVHKRRAEFKTAKRKRLSKIGSQTLEFDNSLQFQSSSQIKLKVGPNNRLYSRRQQSMNRRFSEAVQLQRFNLGRPLKNSKRGVRPDSKININIFKPPSNEDSSQYYSSEEEIKIRPPSLNEQQFKVDAEELGISLMNQSSHFRSNSESVNATLKNENSSLFFNNDSLRNQMIKYSIDPITKQVQSGSTLYNQSKETSRKYQNTSSILHSRDKIDDSQFSSKRNQLQMILSSVPYAASQFSRKNKIIDLGLESEQMQTPYLPNKYAELSSSRQIYEGAIQGFPQQSSLESPLPFLLLGQIPERKNQNQLNLYQEDEEILENDNNSKRVKNKKVTMDSESSHYSEIKEADQDEEEETKKFGVQNRQFYGMKFQHRDSAAKDRFDFANRLQDHQMQQKSRTTVDHVYDWRNNPNMNFNNNIDESINEEEQSEELKVEEEENKIDKDNDIIKQRKNLKSKVKTATFSQLRVRVDKPLIKRDIFTQQISPSQPRKVQLSKYVSPFSLKRMINTLSSSPEAALANDFQKSGTKSQSSIRQSPVKRKSNNKDLIKAPSTDLISYKSRFYRKQETNDKDRRSVTISEAVSIAIRKKTQKRRNITPIAESYNREMSLFQNKRNIKPFTTLKQYDYKTYLGVTQKVTPMKDDMQFNSQQTFSDVVLSVTKQKENVFFNMNTVIDEGKVFFPQQQPTMAGLDSQYSQLLIYRQASDQQSDFINSFQNISILEILNKNEEDLERGIRNKSNVSWRKQDPQQDLQQSSIVQQHSQSEMRTVILDEITKKFSVQLNNELLKFQSNDIAGVPKAINSPRPIGSSGLHSSQFVIVEDEQMPISQQLGQQQRQLSQHFQTNIEYFGDPSLMYLAQFNEDMSHIALNIFETYTLFDIVNKSSLDFHFQGKDTKKAQRVITQRQDNIDAKLNEIEELITQIKDLEEQTKSLQQTKSLVYKDFTIQQNKEIKY